MFQLLSGGKCVGDLTMLLKLEQTLVSHHLSVLKKCGLVKTIKIGKWTRCSISPKMLTDIHELFDATFQTQANERDIAKKKYTPKQKWKF